jgi:hypothetical protein
MYGGFQVNTRNFHCFVSPKVSRLTRKEMRDIKNLHSNVQTSWFMCAHTRGFQQYTRHGWDGAWFVKES